MVLVKRPSGGYSPGHIEAAFALFCWGGLEADLPGDTPPATLKLLRYGPNALADNDLPGDTPPATLKH